MGPALLLYKKYCRLSLFSAGLVNKEQLLRRFLTASSGLYMKKKTSEYECVDQEKYGDLVRCVTSFKDSSQTPESLFEEDNRLYGPVSKRKHLAKEADPRIPGNWVPLMNPAKNSLLQEASLRPPLRIGLERHKMASVTTVLQQTVPLEQAFFLERWKRKMILELGQEGFAEYTKDIFQQGKLFHAAVEELLLAEENPVQDQEEHSSTSSYLASIQHVLQDVSGVRALESAVQHENLRYQGLVDCVAEYRGTLCVIDWKTSGKPKPLLRNTFDNPLQIAAYVGAVNHDARYDFQVDCGLLVVAYKDGSPAHAHLMDPELCSQYWNKWLLRLEEFREKGKDGGTV
ncbi:PREDICTED: mitochondrial genome maintenance exonuclease 1 [Gekko japonicus]|uniref:Mitochondrial genome maintenance exonuclease 1 n=1 Tax=Gekko japonicus TaxID=146911 RepID=A0ABM1JPF2_GEKJA|nr:PREDICTED: mitochondrial genome maintenance exonuclease 1 [Gekko japonicus]